MSFWGDFKDTISTPIKNAANALASIIPGAAGIGGQSVVNTLPMQDRATGERVLRQNVQKALLENKPFDVNVEQQSNDLILKAAIAVNDKFLSPVIFRPMATAGLLADPDSPLYKKGEYEKGFQLQDIKDAYNRSAEVSKMQALTKSTLIPIVPALSEAILSLGGINTDDINLWDDKSIEKNFSDNVVGKYFTGTGDFLLGNWGINATGKLAVAGAREAGRFSGLYNKGKTSEEFLAEANDGILWANSNGTKGTQTTSGSHMVELAQTKDFARIDELVFRYSTNGRLTKHIYEASKPEVVLDIIAADKGNLAALERLAKTDPDILFDMADTKAQLVSKQLLTGEAYVPVGPAVERIKLAFDTAIAKNPKFDELRKSFLDDSYNPLVGGKDYYPLEPKFARNAYIKATTAIRGAKAEVRYREFEKLGEILELRLGDRIGGLATTFVKFAARQSGYKPLGFVTFSGVRPFDGRIELNAFLDDIPLFKNGAASIEVEPNVYKKVADVRREFETVYVNAKDSVEEVAALEAIDERIGFLIAYSKGLYRKDVIKKHVVSFRSHINKGSKGFQENQYAIDHQGNAVTTNAQTLRQLAESYRFTPWNIIESDFIKLVESSGVKANVKLTGEMINSFYEDLSRLWTFDVLARPMFIFKQSIAEPLITASVASGMEFMMSAFPTFVSNSIKNNRNRIMQLAYKARPPQELKAINAALTHKHNTLDKAISIKDKLQVELEELLSGRTAPSIVEQHGPRIRKELDLASKLVDEIEGDIYDATVPFGMPEAIPSLSLLERRIAYIEANVTGDKAAMIGSAMANARAAIGVYKGSINSLATNTKVLKEVEKNLSKAYDDIDVLIKDMGELKVRQADVFGKSAEYKIRYAGKKDNYRMIAGEWVPLDSFVNDASGNNFARAMRAEVSNSRTTEQNYIGELSVGTRKSILERKVPNMPVEFSNPIYFEELKHIANNILRQDPLMDLIFADTPLPELYKWAISQEGVSYLKHFGIVSDKQIPSYLQEKIALVNRYFPSKQARATIAEREVTSQELQKMLSPYADRMFSISPSDFNYAEAQIFGKGWYTVVENFIGNNVSRVFRALTSPENPIREMYFDKIALDAVARKAESLIAQGVKMTDKGYNALRQSAGREAIQDLEKTVYTVRRHNRALHAARVLAAFPTPTLNAFYRYGRLAVKNPVRTTGFLYNYGATFMNFGVDRNGNPTENPNEIAWIIVPGTKELGVNNGVGAPLNAKSLGFMLNFFSPSFIVGLSAGNIMKQFPDTEDWFSGKKGPQWIKDALGAGYEIAFPYGAPDSVSKAFTPPWLNAAWNAVTGDMGRADYLASYRSVYGYHKTLVELGIEKTFPGDDVIQSETKALWSQKARWSFASPFGVPIKVNTQPMDLMDTLYNTLMNKYTKQGKDLETAKALAGDEMLSVVGPKFMVDRVSFSGSNKNVYVIPTVESFNRIMVDNQDLVKTLSEIEKDDITLVGLLGADLEYDPEERNTAIFRKLNDPKLTLPNSSKLINRVRMTPQEEELVRLKNRTWIKYENLRTALEGTITDGKSFRAHPELQAALEQAAKTEFRNDSQAWFDEWNGGVNGDNSYKYGRAFNEIVNNKAFMEKHGNTPFWQDVVTFNAVRNASALIYNSLPDRDSRKAKIKEAYYVMIDNTVAGYHPKLANFIKNYFSNDNLKVVK